MVKCALNGAKGKIIDAKCRKLYYIPALFTAFAYYGACYLVVHIPSYFFSLFLQGKIRY